VRETNRVGAVAKTVVVLAAMASAGGGPLGPTAVVAQETGGWWSWALPAVLDGAPLRTARGDIVLRRPGGSDQTAGRAEGQGAGKASRGDGNASASGEGPPGRAKRRGNGPPFCRDGRGHPVHGLEWCRDKGWDDEGRLWQRASWPDVILGGPDRDADVASRGGLAGVLGDILLGRVEERTRYLGADGSLAGRWVDAPDGATILQIKAGDVPVAELTDADGDGRADGVLLLEAM
jgi:hypothetical protein